MIAFPARLRQAALGFALSGCTALSCAATLQISPVTIELSAAVNGAAVTLANPGDTPLYGQLRVFKWDQQNGEDVLSPSQGLAASPPLIEVAPGEEQLVRVVRNNGSDEAKEQSYRIIIDEIADEQALPRSGVVIRMRYSVPVFVDNGLAYSDGPQLDWMVSRGAKYWQLRIDNKGQQRARINSVWLLDAKGRRHVVEEGLLGYALANRYHVWDLKIPASVELGSRPEFHATVNAKPVSFAAVNRPWSSQSEKGEEP